MKLVKACIRFRMVKQVYEALTEEGFRSMTFVECDGTGNYSDHEKIHLNEKYPFSGTYRVIKLEILIGDKDVPLLVRTISASARTGYSGDGMIIVSPVENVFKIRTDEIDLDKV